MGDEATLTIRFRDESQASGSGPGDLAPQGNAQSSQDAVQSTQQAITQAGGIGRFTTTQQGPAPTVTPAVVAPTAATEIPTTATVTTSNQEAMLQQFIQRLLQQDPNITPQELQSLGIPVSQSRDILQQTQLPTPGPTASAAGTERLPIYLQQLQDELNDQDRMQAASREYEEALQQNLRRLNRLREQREAEAEADANAAWQRRYELPTPPPLTREQQIEEAQRRAPPVQGDQAVDAEVVEESGDSVRNAAGMLASIARMGGPIAGAAGQLGRAATAIPGVSASIASAFPGLATVAPYAIGAAAIGAAQFGLATATIGTIAAGEAAAESQIMGLSVEASMASTQASIREFEANVRTSRRLGDEVAANINARSRISSEYQRLRDSLLEGPLQDLNKNLDLLSRVMKSVSDVAESNPEVTNTLTKQAVRGLLWLAFGNQGVLAWDLGSIFGQTTTKDPAEYLQGTLLNIVPENLDPFDGWVPPDQKGATGGLGGGFGGGGFF